MKNLTVLEAKGPGSVKKAEAKRAAKKKREEKADAKEKAKAADSDDDIANALRQALNVAGAQPEHDVDSETPTEAMEEPLRRVIKTFLECEEFEEAWQARKGILKRMATTKGRLTQELNALVAADNVSGFPESLRTRGQELVGSYSSYLDDASAWQEDIATKISTATSEAATGWPPPSLWIAAELLPYNGKTIACTRFALYSRHFPGLTAVHLAMVERLVHNNYFPDLRVDRRRRRIKLYSPKPRESRIAEPATARWATLLRLVKNAPRRAPKRPPPTTER